MPGLFGRFTQWDLLIYFFALVFLIVLIRFVAPRYYEKSIAVAALGSFVAFLIVVGVWVESISLRIVLALAALMAGYDFWLDAFSKKNNGSGR